MFSVQSIASFLHLAEVSQFTPKSKESIKEFSAKETLTFLYCNIIFMTFMTLITVMQKNHSHYHNAEKSLIYISVMQKRNLFVTEMREKKYCH